MGYCYLMMDSFERAYKQFDMATKSDPQFAEAYYKQGVCAEQLGRPKEALALYYSSLNLKPEYTLASNAIKRLERK
jgi:tetratricopeptide (TPR) repeat protein